MLIADHLPILYTVTEIGDEHEAWAMDSLELLEEFGEWPILQEAVDMALDHWPASRSCSNPIFFSTGCGIMVQAHFPLPLYIKH